MILVLEAPENILEEMEKRGVEYRKIEREEEINDYCVIVSERKREWKNDKILAWVKPDIVKILKWDIRFKTWRKLLKSGEAKPPFPIFGRIPNFKNAEEAAKKLLEIKEFLKAENVLVNPDSPQRPVRELVLKMDKRLIMPTPKLKKGFLLIENPPNIKEASTIKGAFKYGKRIDDFYVDFVVQGSVAVDLNGNRVGKGGGFGDLEIKLARRKNPNVLVATTVHPLQIVKEIPRERQDEKIDIIVTKDEIIWTKRQP